MRLFVAGLCLIAAISIAVAQESQTDTNVMGPEGGGVGDAMHGIGRNAAPVTSGQAQPQGSPGPVQSQSGGAAAQSPQGQTSPGTKSAPEGSDKTDRRS